MIDFKQKMEEIDKREGAADDELLLKRRRRVTAYLIAFLVIGLVFSGKIIMSSQNAGSWLPGVNFLDRLRRLVPIGDKQLTGEDSDRVNILLLGQGGEGHDGAYLTDTIMLASLKPSTKQVALVSVPRDLTAPVSGWRKINSVNAYAEQAKPGSGGEATSKAIGELFQVDIPYYVRIDFSGFERIIDEIGGVEINVENAFDDYSYPILGQEDNPDYYARFEHLHFDAGLQKMDGSRALKYARSRHAYGPEGSDFARARRQQLLLEAVKEKLLSRQTLLNPSVLSKLISEFNKDVSTNLGTWEMIRLWNLFKDTNRDQIINKVLSDAPDGLLVSGKGTDGAYILTPRSGNFSEIRRLVQNIFETAPATSTNTQKTEQPSSLKPIDDHAKVYVANGTWISGLAGKTSSTLAGYDFKVTGTGNAVDRNYERNVVYDLTSGAKNDSLTTLKKLTGATQAFNSPAWLEEYKAGEKKSDFLLILGTEADK